MIRALFLSDFPLSSCVWQSTIFLVVGLVGSFILKYRSSRAHQVLFLAMIAAVIVPVMSILVKHYELGMLVAEPVVIQSRAEDVGRGGNYRAPGIISAENIEHNPGLIEKNSLPDITGSESAEFPWRSLVLGGWITASLILAARLLVTFVLGVRLLGRALPLDCQRIKEAAHLARTKLEIDTDVRVHSSQSVRSPVIWCWRRRPVLLVPSAAGQFDNGVDWAGVLCHELAHWKRRDHISGLLAELAVCILPWHPLLWWAKSRLVRLSEQACDDWVVASGQPSTDYAESLLDLTPGGQMAFVPAVVSSKKGLAGRVRRILKDSCGNPRTGVMWALAASIVVACIAVGVAFAQTRPAEPEAATPVTKPDESVEPNEPTVALHFKNVKVEDIVRNLSEWTGKTIIPTGESMKERMKERMSIYAPEKMPRSEAIEMIFNALRLKGYVTKQTPYYMSITFLNETNYRVLPADWNLDYDDGFVPGRVRRWPANMAKNLASLQVSPRPVNAHDDSWKNERFEFSIRSLDGAEMGSLWVRPEPELREMRRKIFQPGKYLLSYERRGGGPGTVLEINCDGFLIDLSRPGMYDLQFSPYIADVEITGSAGGCYAINFEKIDQGIPVHGLAYINRAKEYTLDGLPMGTYRLSAVAQQHTGNVLVSQAQITIESENKVNFDIAPPPKGNCSLTGSILGRQQKYKAPGPNSRELEGEWFILIRKPGSGAIEETNVYEALTMDSLYVVRGGNIKQETKDKASYKIEDIAPGEYTVTAIEKPSLGGFVVTRQQSRPLTLLAGEKAVLDFDLRDTHAVERNTGVRTEGEQF